MRSVCARVCACACVRVCVCVCGGYVYVSYQFQETLGSGVVVTLLIGQVQSTRGIHTCVHMGHKLAH